MQESVELRSALPSFLLRILDYKAPIAFPSFANFFFAVLVRVFSMIRIVTYAVPTLKTVLGGAFCAQVHLPVLFRICREKQIVLTYLLS